MEAVVPVSFSGHPAQVERCVTGNYGDVGWRNWKETKTGVGERKGNRNEELVSVMNKVGIM